MEELKRIDPIAQRRYASFSQNGRHLDNTTISRGMDNSSLRDGKYISKLRQ
jgi:hypothetical protein